MLKYCFYYVGNCYIRKYYLTWKDTYAFFQASYHKNLNKAFLIKDTDSFKNIKYL